jgi:hypothetical protein
MDGCNVYADFCNAASGWQVRHARGGVWSRMFARPCLQHGPQQAPGPPRPWATVPPSRAPGPWAFARAASIQDGLLRTLHCGPQRCSASQRLSERAPLARLCPAHAQGGAGSPNATSGSLSFFCAGSAAYGGAGGSNIPSMLMFFHQRTREIILFRPWLPTTTGAPAAASLVVGDARRLSSCAYAPFLDHTSRSHFLYHSSRSRLPKAKPPPASSPSRPWGWCPRGCGL